MKIKGQVIDKVNEVICVIPRGNGDDIVFIARGVLDFDEFNQLCPQPEAPEVVLPNGKKKRVTNDPDFVAAIKSQSQRQIDWMILKSLEATPELEWETVEMADNTTWGNFRKELEDAKFTVAEVGRIQGAVYEANSLSESAVATARENFLNGQQEQEEA